MYSILFQTHQVITGNFFLWNHQQLKIFKNLTIFSTLFCLIHRHLSQQTQRLPILKITNFSPSVKFNTQRLLLVVSIIL